MQVFNEIVTSRENYLLRWNRKYKKWVPLSLPEPVLPNWTTDKKKCICNVQYPITLKTRSTCATEQALFTFNLLNWNWSQPQKKKQLTLTLMLPKTLSCKVFAQVVFRQHPYKTGFSGFAYLLGYHQWHWFCHSSTRAAMLHHVILRECNNFLQYRTQNEQGRLQHPSVQILLVSVYLKHIKLIALKRLFSSF